MNLSPENTLSTRQAALILTGLLLGILLEALDTTVVNTALRTILTDLGGKKTMLGWVVGAYLLMITVTTPIYGRLSDLYGRMPFYLGGMGLFMVGSILCGFSQTIQQLIVCRALQGLGAGAMMPLAIALVQTVFPKHQQGKIQGLVPLAFGVAIIFGPSIGGLITDHLGWRWLFFLNLPFGLAAISLLYLYLPTHVRQRTTTASSTLDPWSVLLLFVSSCSVVLGFLFVEILHLSWASLQTIGIFLGALFLGLLFVWRNRKQTLPLIPMKLFTERSFSLSVLASFLIAGVLLWNLALYIPMFMQTIFNISPTRSGVSTTPMMVGMLIGSFSCGRLFGRAVQRYKILAIASSMLVLVGMGLIATLGTQSSQASVVVYTVIAGMGIGASMPLYGLIAANSIDKKDIGLSFGLIAFFRNFGGAFSTAFFGSIFGSLLFDLQQKQNALVKGGIPSDTALMSQGFHRVFLVGLYIAGLAFVVTLCLPNKKIDLRVNRSPATP